MLKSIGTGGSESGQPGRQTLLVQMGHGFLVRPDRWCPAASQGGAISVSQCSELEQSVSHVLNTDHK